MIDPAAVRKQLKIKSSATQRLAKEAKLYATETTALEAKRAKFIADGAEEWDIKNATKMVDESKKMIVDAKTRLEKAVEDLQLLITSAKAAEFEVEELINAEKIVQEANEL